MQSAPANGARPPAAVAPIRAAGGQLGRSARTQTRQPTSEASTSSAAETEQPKRGDHGTSPVMRAGAHDDIVAGADAPYVKRRAVKLLAQLEQDGGRGYATAAVLVNGSELALRRLDGLDRLRTLPYGVRGLVAIKAARRRQGVEPHAWPAGRRAPTSSTSVMRRVEDPAWACVQALPGQQDGPRQPRGRRHAEHRLVLGGVGGTRLLVELQR